MKVTFTGKQNRLSAVEERKLATRFAKLSKLLERRGEKEARVALRNERHLQIADVTVNYNGQALVGTAAETDQFTAMMLAIEHLEKQAVKMRSKWRDTKRSTPVRAARTNGEVPASLSGNGMAPAKKAAVKVAPKPKTQSKVRRPAAVKPNGKPMTVQEAMLTMDSNQDYVVYHDSETKKTSVLVRRRDGNLDLIEP